MFRAKSSSYAGWRARTLVCMLMAALVSPVAAVMFESWHLLHFTYRYYLGGMIYTFCIGGLLSPISPLVWKGTNRLHPFLRWLVRCEFIVVGSVAGCLLAGLPMRLMIGPVYDYWRSFRDSYGISILLSVLASTMLLVYDRFQSKLQTTQLQLKEQETAREKALKLVTEATLSSLESRMHPHFLFNTLNSISALIQEEPARAEKMLTQMADLLRFSLDSARSGLVPLSSELKIVRDYLEIEKARFADRLRYDIEVSDEFAELPFPPLSLQTLVENSVKYAVSATRGGADILIRAHRHDSHVVLSVEDNGPGFDVSYLPAGHGLSSLTERLRSLYANSASIEISSKAGKTVIELHVPTALIVSKA